MRIGKHLYSFKENLNTANKKYYNYFNNQNVKINFIYNILSLIYRRPIWK